MSTSIETIDIRSVIDQLVGQQFFLFPNKIVDRTHRIYIEVKNSDIVFKCFTNYLYQKSRYLYGTEPHPYIAILSDAGKKLRLENNALEKRFQEKAGSFLKEGLATESILFISTIATILEVLDYQHYKKLLKELKSAFRDYCLKNLEENSPINQEDIFMEGIKRLGEVADPSFSILQNLVKLRDLADIFHFESQTQLNLNFLEKKYEEHEVKVLKKILSGEY